VPGLIAGGPLHTIDLAGGLLLFGVGGFGVAAQLCMTAAYNGGRTIAVANLAYSTVVFSSLFGILLWHEHLPLLAWAGIGLIIVSGVTTTLLAGSRMRTA
jgi:drug/metabolite transporter (DMT)-like permease